MYRLNNGEKGGMGLQKEGKMWLIWLPQKRKTDLVYWQFYIDKLDYLFIISKMIILEYKHILEDKYLLYLFLKYFASSQEILLSNKSCHI